MTIKDLVKILFYTYSPGEDGKAIVVNQKDLTIEQLNDYKTGYKNNAFNEYASKLMSLHRFTGAIPDEEM